MVYPVLGRDVPPLSGPKQEPLGKIFNRGNVPQKPCLKSGTTAELTRLWGRTADSFLLWNVPANKGNDEAWTEVTIHRKRKTLTVSSFALGIVY